MTRLQASEMLTEVIMASDGGEERFVTDGYDFHEVLVDLLIRCDAAAKAEAVLAFAQKWDADEGTGDHEAETAALDFINTQGWPLPAAERTNG